MGEKSLAFLLMLKKEKTGGKIICMENGKNLAHPTTWHRDGAVPFIFLCVLQSTIFGSFPITANQYVKFLLWSVFFLQSIMVRVQIKIKPDLFFQEKPCLTEERDRLILVEFLSFAQVKGRSDKVCVKWWGSINAAVWSSWMSKMDSWPWSWSSLKVSYRILRQILLT